MTKNLQIALVVLAVLIGIFFLNNKSQSKLESTSEAIFTDDVEDIFKFLIQNGEEAIELSRIDTIWQISGIDTLEVKSQSINNLFDKVLKVNRGTIISENPEKYEKYFVDDSTGTHLAVIDSKGETVGYVALEESVRQAAIDFMSIHANKMLHLEGNNLDEKYFRFF